jgi:hypothetical protein
VRAAEKILSRVSKEQMLETYKISMFENTREFLELVAKKGGKQSKVRSSTMSPTISTCNKLAGMVC